MFVSPHGMTRTLPSDDFDPGAQVARRHASADLGVVYGPTGHPNLYADAAPCQKDLILGRQNQPISVFQFQELTGAASCRVLERPWLTCHESTGN